MSDIEPDDSISQPVHCFSYPDDNSLAEKSTFSAETSTNGPSEWKQYVFPTLKCSTLFHVHDQRTKVEASKFLKVSHLALLYTNRQSPWTNFKWRFEGRAGTSSSWPMFWEGVHRTSGEPRVVCKACHQDFRHPKHNHQSTTTELNRHLSNCSLYLRSKSATSGTTLYFNVGKKRSRNSELTSANVHDQVLKFFISGNIPFQQVKNPQFKELLSFIKIDCHDYITQSRKSLRTNLTSWCELAKQDLTSILCHNDSKVSLALDCWTSRTKDPYLGM
jgi:hypothetical protein